MSAACVACCALPLVASLAAAASIATLTFDWIGVAAFLSGVAFVLWWLARQGGAASARTACGCASVTDAPPVACTLTPGDFSGRVAWIRDLARDSLRAARRYDLTLHLAYERAAAPRVREMIEKERACCAFLRFDVREDESFVHVTIVAPEQARDAADDLFAHFAPELATPSNQLPATQPTSATKETV